MYLDVIDLNKFYFKTNLGRMTQKLLISQLQLSFEGRNLGNIVGFGYTLPYLNYFHKFSENCYCLMPAQQGVVHWPEGSKNKSLLVEETFWPLKSASIDTIIVAHGIEASENVNSLLKQIYRVLVPGGKVVFIVPNRSGLWARSDLTPFGHGRPYTLRQFELLLKKNKFKIDSYSGALYGTPSSRKFWIKTMIFLDKFGSKFDLKVLSGALVVLASKQIYAKPSSGLKEVVIDKIGVLEDIAKPKPKPKPISLDFFD